MPYGRSVNHQFVIRTPRRDALQQHLREKGVASLVHYPLVLPLQPAMAAYGAKRGDFPIAEQCADESLSLPIPPELTDAEVEQVSAAVRSFF